MTPHPMQQFHDMLATILANGRRRPNRTGVDTLFVPGQTLRFDMADGFPAITTRKLAFKAARGELLGFFRGYQSAAQFRELGCKVWDANANETKSWLDNPHRKGEDDLGRIYSSQWTDWRQWTEIRGAQLAEALAQGYELIAHDKERDVVVVRRGMNQLELALRAIMTNPTDRRIMITGWRPDEFELMALPPCHVDYQFLVDVEAGELHMCFLQRSFDSALAFNISLGALFLHIMARLAGLQPRTMTQFIGDAHIYVTHLEAVNEMLTREHYDQPELVLGDSVPTLTSVDQIPGAFARIEPDDITLAGYKCHPPIAMAMAA